MYPDIGVNFHGMWSTYTDSQRDNVLAQYAAAGMTTVRLDVSWAMIQPTNGTSYDMVWGVPFVDSVITRCNAHGITPLIMFWTTPAWANGGAGGRVLPTSPATYATAAGWVAARYHTSIAGIEVWNEPNSNDFLAGASPTAYVALLGPAYTAIHAAGVPVVFGGLQYCDDTWLSAAYTAGAHGKFDVMAIHPYMGMADATPLLPDDGTMWVMNHAPIVRNLMVAHGDGDKSLWFTEFGWSTHTNPPNTPNSGRGVGEITQGKYFTKAWNLVKTTMPYVGKIYWYDDRDSNEGSVQNSHYGLLRSDLSAKPIMAEVYAATHA